MLSSKPTSRHTGKLFSTEESVHPRPRSATYGNTRASKQQKNAAATKPTPPPPRALRAAAPVADVSADPVEGGAVKPVSGSSGCASLKVGDGEAIGEGAGLGGATGVASFATGAGVTPSPSGTSRERFSSVGAGVSVMTGVSVKAGVLVAATLSVGVRVGSPGLGSLVPGASRAAVGDGVVVPAGGAVDELSTLTAASVQAIGLACREGNIVRGRVTYQPKTERRSSVSV